LLQKGCKIKLGAKNGRVDAILITKWGYYEGGADSRGDDTKLGYIKTLLFLYLKYEII
jgi:gamma-glutamyltranspeptidase/glutathione hydrolase